MERIQDFRRFVRARELCIMRIFRHGIKGEKDVF
jgi:hypothetical protein